MRLSRLFLLTEVEETLDGTLDIDGRLWRLQPYDLSDMSFESLQFICISYSWGSGREPSPFQESFLVSDRTVPALKAVARLRPACKRIWVDAFCVPLATDERQLTLESMGYIYSEADEVIAVLSSSVLPTLRYMRENEKLTEEHMFALEKDEWVTRAWTYQEAVNAKALFITCEDSHNAIIDAHSFLNYLGCALHKLVIRPLERRARYPGLDTLEDLVDYLTAGYEERSALQVMAKMDRRTQQRPEDHFYAMIGAVSSSLASSTGTTDACESFMRICETKEDLSFIYSAASREAVPGRRWRPVSGDLPAILQWDSTGSGQPGRVTEDGLLLERVIKLGLNCLTQKAGTFIHTWLVSIQQISDGDGTSDISADVFQALRLIGFTGSDKSLSTQEGLFFPFEYMSAENVDCVLVSSTLEWRFGSPGLVCYRSSGDVAYTPGVFVGSVELCPTTSVRVG